MKICFLMGDITGTGGIGRVVSILTEALASYGDIGISVLSFFNRNNNSFYKLADNIDQEVLLEKPASMRKAFLKAQRKLRIYLKSKQIDILIACGVLFFPLCVVVTRFSKTKLICWEHGNYYSLSTHRFKNINRWIGIGFADAVVTLTKKDAHNFMIHHKNVNVQDIYDPLPDDLFEKSFIYDINIKKIISVGRLSYEKNYELAVEIAAEVFKKHPDWQWHIYGDGPERENIFTKTEELGIQDKLILKGICENIYDRYSEYGMLVHTARFEGFGMVLVEAMSRGLPVLSFDVHDGPNEIIAHEENGYLIEPLNAKSMTEHICRLIEDDNLRLSFSNQSHQDLFRFKAETICQKWIVLFEVLMNKELE